MYAPVTLTLMLRKHHKISEQDRPEHFEGGIRSQDGRLEVTVPCVTKHVTLDKSFDLLEHCFLICEVGIILPISKCCGESM